MSPWLLKLGSQSDARPYITLLDTIGCNKAQNVGRDLNFLSCICQHPVRPMDFFLPHSSCIKTFYIFINVHYDQSNSRVKWTHLTLFAQCLHQ